MAKQRYTEFAAPSAAVGLICSRTVTIRSNVYYSVSFSVRCFLRSRVFSFFFYFNRWCIWTMFLLWDRFLWFTCYNRNYVYSRRFLTSVSIPLNWKLPFRFRIWNIILTFCRCSMIIVIFISLSLRFLIIYLKEEKNIKTKCLCIN